MVSANLDLQDLNVLLSTYAKDQLKLKESIEKLKDIQSTENNLEIRVGKDFLKVYINLDRIENDIDILSDTLDGLEKKIPYIKKLIDKEESMTHQF